MKLWFGRKKYGWGWTPCSKEGWFVTLVFIALVMLSARYLLEEGKVSFFYESLIILIAVFLLIAYKTGERPKWSWG